MSSSAVVLQQVTDWMTTISLFFLISFGLFGCISNIIIFTSKKLEKNSCAFYFLCAAIFESLILCIGGVSRLATEHFGSQFLNENQSFCRIRSYLITTLGTIATYLLLLAAIDRCMATSSDVRYRAFSQKKIARRVAFITIIIIMIINIHIFIFFDLQPTCIPQPGIYSIFYSLYLIVGTGIIPDGLIILFTAWTFQNVKKLRMRNTTNVITHTFKQKAETHLIMMMLTQCIVSVLLDFTRISCYSYYFLTANNLKTTYDILVAVFIFQFGNVLLYITYAQSFYINTLASSLFRKIFCDLIRYYYGKLTHFNRVAVIKQ